MIALSMLRGFLGSRRALSLAALACIALIVVSVNIVAARFLNARLDLTQEGLYTLSPGTLQTIAQIDEPITLRFYYSTRLGDEVPSYGVYAERVRELLEQYAAAAHGKIRLEMLNPQPYSDIEDQAVAFGLQAVPLNEQGEQVYFGLAGTNSTDDVQVIPFFSADRERMLEYNLTKLVHALAFPKKTVVGLMTELPLAGNMAAAMQGRPSEPMAIFQQLKQLYDVQSLATSVDKIPPDIDVLMLVQPQHLSQQTLFAIDQFVLRGGRALIFVDPYSEIEAALARGADNPGLDTASTLAPLLQSWGVEMMPGVVAGDRPDARRVGVPLPNGGMAPMDFVAWLDLKPPELNRNDLITADLGQVTMATAGILRPIAGATTKLEPLITTAEDSTRIPVAKISGLPDVAGLLANFKSDHRRYTLAARVTGMAKTAFPDGPPKAPQTANQPGDAAKDKAKAAAANPDPQTKAAAKPTKPTAWLKQSEGPIHVIVVADTDMLADRFWAQTEDFFGRQVIVPVANNGDFVENAIDVLAGGDDLVGLRTRGTSARPFVVVERLRRAADLHYSAEQHALEDSLKATQAKLDGLTGKDGGAAVALSSGQIKAIDQFRANLLATRKQLRHVQAALRGDIERLKGTLEFVDIALIPILVAAAAIVLGALRLRRRRRTAYS